MCCQVSRSFYNFNSSILYSSYFLYTIILTAVAVTILLFEVNFQSSVTEIAVSITPSIAVIFILLAGFTCLISDSKFLQSLFLILFVLTLVFQVAVSALTFTQHIDHRYIVKKVIQRLVTEKYEYSNDNTAIFWDHIQQEFSCCGSSSPLDWAESRFNNKALTESGHIKEIGVISRLSIDFKKMNVPQSCCRSLMKECTTELVDNMIPPSIFMEGCSEKIISAFDQNYSTILAWFSGFYLTQFLILITAFVRVCYKIERK